MLATRHYKCVYAYTDGYNIVNSLMYSRPLYSNMTLLKCTNCQPYIGVKGSSVFYNSTFYTVSLMSIISSKFERYLTNFPKIKHFLL